MGCIFRPEALSWEDIDGGRGEMTMEAIRNFISEYCYRRATDSIYAREEVKENQGNGAEAKEPE